MNYQLDVCTAGNFSLHLTDCEIKYNLGYNSNFSFIDSFSLNRMDLTKLVKCSSLDTGSNPSESRVFPFGSSKTQEG